LRSLEADLPPHNLPTQATPFVGRGPELEALDAMFADPDVRLISIVAAGGMGKTRLALASSENQVSITERTNGKVAFRFPHGVYFVPLAPLDSPSSILPALAEAMYFQIGSSEGRGLGIGAETRTPKKQLLDYLRSKRLLLVMDNFEHLLEGADLLTDILGYAPEVKILVTSRERLHLKGEHLFPLLGMKFPDMEKVKPIPAFDHEAYSALSLFQQSAQRIQPNFHIHKEHLSNVVSICRLVGGMPLGIELAASWVNMLTLEKITMEIQRSLDFLETNLRDVDERHRSIRAVFDSTWDRLSHPERDLFEELTVFQGGFTVEAAEEITGASLALLGNLTNRSLLQFDHTRGTYEIHELLGQFGAERVAQDPEKEKLIRDKHSIYYCKLLSRLETDLKGSRHMNAMEQVEADFDNITAAWRWASEQGKVELISNALESMDVYYTNSGRWEEGEEIFHYPSEKMLDRRSVDSLRLQVRLNNIEARFMTTQKIDKKQELIEKNWGLLKSSSLVHEDTRWEEAALIILVGIMQKDPRETLRHFREAYDLYESLDDRWNMARISFNIGHISSQILADRDEAIFQIEKSLPIFRELGYKKGIVWCLNRLSAMAMFTNELDKTERYLSESMNISEELNDQQTLGTTLDFVGFLYTFRGEFKAAHQTFSHAVTITEDLGHTEDVAESSIYIARTENFLGKYHDAFERLLQIKKYSELENNLWIFGLWLLESGRSLLGEGDCKAACESMQASIELFRRRGDMTYMTSTIPTLIIPLYRLGGYSGMIDVMQEALQLNAKIRRPLSYIQAFPALALLKLAEGRAEKAIEYYAYAASYPYIANSQWYQDLVGRHIEDAAESLSPEVVAAAQERGQKLDPEKVIQELLLEMKAQDESVKSV